MRETGQSSEERQSRSIVDENQRFSVSGKKQIGDFAPRFARSLLYPKKRKVIESQVQDIRNQE